MQYLATGKLTVSTKLAGLYSALGEESGICWVDKPEDILEAAIKLLNSPNYEKNNAILAGEKLIKEKFEKTLAIEKFENTIRKTTLSNSND